jgi:hypothetical protein
VKLSLLPLALPLSLAAQTYYSPAAAASAQGNVNNTLPFAQTAAHYQQVHSASSFNVPAVGILTRMRWRAKATTTAGTADLELFLARSPNAAENASTTFANNEMAGTLVNVFTRKMVNMPSVGPGLWGAPDLTFDTPFIGLANQHLSWRVVIYSNTSTPYTLDCFSDWRFGVPTAYNGCQHPQGTQTAKHNSTFRSPGNVWDLNGYSYLPNTVIPGALMIGNSNSMWGNISLPFDMTPIGAPGCVVVNNPAIVIGGMTISNPTGFMGVPVNTPRDPSMVNQTIYTQFAFIEPGANPLGVFTSQGRVNTPIPSSIEVTRIYSTSSTATSGTLGPDFALPIGIN